MPYQTHLGAENALFLPKKGPPIPKNLSRYPYFAVPNAPRSQKSFIFTQKRAPGTEATFSIAKPEPTGNPSKNPKKHLKKPLPPVRCTADGREEGGWLGWLGWAGWVTAEAGLAGLAGLTADVDG